MAETRALDLTHFPLVVVVIPAKIDATYADLLEADHKVLFAKRARYVSISDSSRVLGMPDAKTRQRMGEWAKSHEGDLKRWQVANAIVVPSSLVRAGLSAIHWFAPPPVPTCIETGMATALAFLRAEAEKAKLSTLGIDAYTRSLRLAPAAS